MAHSHLPCQHFHVFLNQLDIASPRSSRTPGVKSQAAISTCIEEVPLLLRSFSKLILQVLKFTCFRITAYTTLNLVTWVQSNCRVLKVRLAPLTSFVTANVCQTVGDERGRLRPRFEPVVGSALADAIRVDQLLPSYATARLQRMLATE